MIEMIKWARENKRLAVKTDAQQHPVQPPVQQPPAQQPTSTSTLTPALNATLSKLGMTSLPVKPITFARKADELPPPPPVADSIEFKYPCPAFKYTRPTDESLGPYSETWIHDAVQCDDTLSPATIKLRDIVRGLLKIEYPPQRSPKWFEMREGSITASDSGCVLGDNPHEPPYKIYIKKILKPPFESNMFCHHGTKYEKIATMIYEYRMNVTVEEFGLVKHPKYSFLAASPDGIVGEYKLDGTNKTAVVGTMLEIKCVYLRRLNDDDPMKGIKYYEDQVKLQLECCDLEECHFWQCQITEYPSRAEFVADTDADEHFRSKCTGREKGCIIQLLPKNKIPDTTDNYNQTVYNNAKFLYPPKINMTPLECDIWIVESLGNLEQTLINETMKRYTAIDATIRQAIQSDDFLTAMNTELTTRIDEEIHKNEWKFKGKNDAYINTIKKNIRIDVTKRFPDEYLTSYPKKIMYPLKHASFIRFLVRKAISSKALLAQLMDDEKLVEKLINLNENLDLFKLLDTTPEYHPVKRLTEFLKDMEFPKNYAFDRVFYWRLEKSLYNTIKRDRKWVADNLPVFEETWKNIAFLRKNPDVAKTIFDYIDGLPTVDDNHGAPLKDNATVMRFINETIATATTIANPKKADAPAKSRKKITLS